MPRNRVFILAKLETIQESHKYLFSTFYSNDYSYLKTNTLSLKSDENIHSAFPSLVLALTSCDLR